MTTIGAAAVASLFHTGSAQAAGLLASGTTSAGSSTVLVYLIPEVYGSSVTLPLVGQTTSSGSGGWSVSISNGTDEQAAEQANAANGGFAAFWVVTQSPSGQVTTEQIERVPTSGAWTEVGGAAPAALDENYSTDSYTTAPDITPQLACTGTSNKSNGNWSTMAEVHAANDIVGGSGHSHYGYGATGDSHIHWMFSPDGGSWTSQKYEYISGSSSTNKGTIPFGSLTSTHVQGTFTYVRTIAGGSCSYLGHQIHARYWDGGLQYANPVSGVDGHCVVGGVRTIDLTPGQTRDKESGTDAAYSSAATVFGVTGFAHYAGWDTKASTHWQAGTAQPNHYLCGNDDVFTQASKIYAGSG